MLETLIRSQIATVNSVSSSFQKADQTTMKQWRDQLAAVDVRVRSIQQQTEGQVTRTEMIVARTRSIEASIRNALSPQMSAALAFDRAVAPTLH
jgi:conjugative transfer pilus assembly protein TraH